MAGTPTYSQADAVTDRSGTITAGGVAQVAITALGIRKGFSIQNTSVGDLWFSDVGTAAAVSPSIKVAPGAYYETPLNGVPKGDISIFGATTGQAFSAREWY